MKLVTCHPFRSLQHEINRVFDDMYTSPVQGHATGWYPSVDVFEEKNAFVIHAELPGVKSEDVKVRVNENVLTLSGEKRQPTKSDQQTFFRIERSFGGFQRSFTFPTNVDPEKISAMFKDGVLTVTLEKQEKASAKEIPVSVS